MNDSNSILKNRQKVLNALRSGEYIKVTFEYGEGKNVCAFGLFRSVLFGGHPSQGGDVMPLLGMLEKEYADILDWNDEEDLSFLEIADKLESRWFATKE